MPRRVLLAASAVLALTGLFLTATAQAATYACVNQSKTQGYLVNNPQQCQRPNHVIRITQSHISRMQPVQSSGGQLKYRGGGRGYIIRCVTVCDKYACVRYCCRGLDECWIQDVVPAPRVY